MFDHPDAGKISGELLSKLRQVNSLGVDHSLEFRTPAASSGWNEAALLVMFCQGLNAKILSELASKDDELTLGQLITLVIKLDHLLCHRNKAKGEKSQKGTLPRVRFAQETTENPEPMQCDSLQLSQEERLRQLNNHLCLYCGKAGHQVCECHARPQKSKVPNPGQVCGECAHKGVGFKICNVASDYLLSSLLSCHFSFDRFRCGGELHSCQTGGTTANSREDPPNSA